MRIHSYVRVSTDDQEVKIQQTALDAYALRKDWHITARHKDEGVSGRKGRGKRKGLDDLCMCIETGQVDVVLFWSVDRVARSLHDFIDFCMLCQKHDVQMIFQQQPNLSADDPMGRAMMQLLGVFAELESNFISARVKESYAYRRSKGETKFGPEFKYGHQDKLKVLALRDKGMTVRQIVAATPYSQGTVGRIVRQHRPVRDHGASVL